MEVRPNSKFLQFAIGEINQYVDFVVINAADDSWEDMLSALSENVRKEDLELRHETISEEMRTLNDIISEYDVPHVDFLSIDVEGYEMSVLKGIDFSKLSPDIILLENTKYISGNKDLRKFLNSFGYVFSFRIATTDDLFIKSELIFVK